MHKIVSQRDERRCEQKREAADADIKKRGFQQKDKKKLKGSKDFDARVEKKAMLIKHESTIRYRNYVPKKTI